MDGGKRGRALGAAWIVAAATLLGACDSVEERVERHYARGVALVEDGEESRALLEFRNALRLNENHAPSRYQIARAYEREDNLRAALGNYRLVTELDPGNADAQLRLARLYLGGGALEDARRHANAALAAAPENAEALAVSAAVAFREGDREAAAAGAQSALERDPDLVEAHVVLVSAQIQDGDAEGAMAAVEALLADAPEEPIYNLLKLQLLAERDDGDALVAHLDVMIDRFPDEPAYRQSLVRLHLQRGDDAAAEAALRALEADAEDPGEAALDVVRFLIERRGRDVARAELEDRIVAAPDVAAAAPFRIALAELTYRDGDAARARALMETIVAEAGESDAGDRARLQLARLDLAEGDRDAARAHVDAVLARDRANPEGVLLRASMLIDDYRPADAVIELRRALESDPQNLQLLLMEARAHERNGNPSLAGERLGSALRISNFAPDVALRYAVFLRGQDQLDTAATVLSEAARRNPTDPRLLAALAEARLRLGDTAGADEAAARLRQVEGGGAVADRVVAELLRQEGRDAESVAILERLIEDPADGGAALAALVAGYLRTGDVDRAEAFLEDLIEDDPGNVRAQVLRAELDLLRGDAAAAEARLRETAETDGSETSHLVLTRFYIATGRPDAAEAAARAGIDRLPDSGPLRLTLAQLLEGRQAFDEAIAEYEILYRANPESIVVANNLASLLAEHREDDPEAIAFASRVAQRLRGSSVPHFQDTFGWIAFLRGDTASALRSLVAAAESLPDNPLVRYHLGRVYAEAGQIGRARENLAAALAIDPTFPKAASAQAALDALPATDG